MLVTIHQPEHLPWLGFLDKAKRAELLVLLDNVQFSKNYFQNRNRVRSSEGAAWVTVPVLSKGNSDQLIADVQINHSGSPRWREKYWGTVEQAYRRSPFWNHYAEPLHAALFADTSSLADLNVRLIELMFGWFDIGTKTVRASEMGVEGRGTQLLADICKSTGATSYLSGVSGRDYLDTAQFAAIGVDILYQEFHHPIYPQRYEPFMPLLSGVDLLFNHGPAAKDILQGVGVEVMEEVFL